MSFTRKASPDSLRIFEAAARHSGFTAAARELRSTQSAVSQRVRGLEEELDLRLFERVHRGVRLTEAGRALFASVSEGFTAIDRTIDQLQRSQRQPRLNILTDFAFAAYWLLPRLPAFRRRHPHVDVRIVTDQGVADQGAPDWRDRQVDVAIVFCDERTLESIPRLFSEEVFPVCSPGFLERYGPIADFQALSDMPLLTLTTDYDPKWLDWRRYFRQQAALRYAAPSKLAFNNYTLLIQAAIAGQGVGLGWRELVDEPLRGGMLVGLHDMRLSSRRGYGLIDARPESPGEAKQALRDWLLAAAGQE